MASANANKKSDSDFDGLSDEEKKTPLPDLDDTPITEEDKRRLKNIVLRRRAISDQIKKLKEQEDEFNARVMKILKRNKVIRTRVSGCPTRIVTAGHIKLDEDMLIERGVSPKLIAKCKKFVPHKEYVRIDPPKA